MAQTSTRANEAEGSSLGCAPAPVIGVDAAWARGRVMSRLLDEVPDPVRIGRYALLSRVGEGGMGVVWAAFDERLDRKIAIKLLRGQVADAGLAPRLLREAQALARLNHPNVVQVYEVGEHDGQLFVAMEFVQGVSLRAWARAVERPWAEVLARYVEAGAGLAAAHAAGLVHRDFKPDNVLVGEDGRVRVLDFGLARRDDAGPSEASGSVLDTALPQAIEDALGAPLTRTGSMMGTPAYMAPEQYLGEPVDGRTDQFAFCVALFEALWGDRPFVGQTRAELLANITRGRVREVGDVRGVPPRIVAAVRRGLSVDPQQRFASMDRLLAALAPAARRGRVAWWIAGASVVAVAATARLWAAAPTDPCGGGPTALAAAWDDTRATTIDRVLGERPEPWAGRTAALVATQLDDYGKAWLAAHREACEATVVRGEQSDERLDRRMACLQRRQQALGAVVDTLIEGDAEVAAHAIDLVGGLPAIDRCSDPVYLDAALAPPDDPALATAVEAARGELAQGQAWLDAGRFADAASLVERVERDAAVREHLPLRAEVLALRGRTALAQHRDAEAILALEAAYLEAVAVGHDDVARSAATDLAFAQAAGGEVASAERWVGLGGAMVKRAASDEERAAHAVAAATLYITRAAPGDLATARTLLDTVIDGDHDHRTTSRARMQQAQLGAAEGDLAAVRRALTLAVEDAERALGPDHPELTLLVANLALRSDPTEAHAHIDRAHRLAAVAPDEAVSGKVWRIEAEMLRREGRLDEAESTAERALAVARSRAAENPRDVILTLGTRALVHRGKQEHTSELALLREALALRESLVGPDSGSLQGDLHMLGNALERVGGFAEAIAMHRRALALAERNFGADAPMTIGARGQLARSLRLSGDVAGALRESRLAFAAVRNGGPQLQPQRLTRALELAEAMADGGAPDEAIALLREELGDDHDSGDDVGPAARADFIAARAHAVLGHGEIAGELIARARRRLRENPKPTSREIERRIDEWERSRAAPAAKKDRG